MSVIIPAYKEEEHIGATLKGVVEVLRIARLSFEIIVVVDVFPGDQTYVHVRKMSKTYVEIHVLERLGKRGVGDAIRAGIAQATGSFIIPVMGDQSENPSDIVRLAKTAIHFDVVFTNRFAHGRPDGYPMLKYVANRSCNLFTMLLFHIPYSDITNAFKAYKLEILNRVALSSDGFEIFLEMPLRVMSLKMLEASEIQIDHIVRKKRTPKLSVIRDGWRYARLLAILKLHPSGKRFGTIDSTSQM